MQNECCVLLSQPALPRLPSRPLLQSWMRRKTARESHVSLQNCIVLEAFPQRVCRRHQNAPKMALAWSGDLLCKCSGSIVRESDGGGIKVDSGSLICWVLGLRSGTYIAHTLSPTQPSRRTYPRTGNARVCVVLQRPHFKLHQAIYMDRCHQVRGPCFVGILSCSQKHIATLSTKRGRPYEPLRQREQS